MQGENKPSTPSEQAAHPVLNTSPELQMKSTSHLLKHHHLFKNYFQTHKRHFAVLGQHRGIVLAAVQQLHKQQQFPLMQFSNQPLPRNALQLHSPHLTSLFYRHELFLIKFWICFLQHKEHNTLWNMVTNEVISSKKSIFQLLLQITLFFVDKIVPQH